MLKIATLLIILFCDGLETREISANSSLTDVCRVCSCIEPVVECRNRGLTTLNHTWPDWSNLKIYLDFNFFPRLTKFPPSNANLVSLAHNQIKRIDEKVFENLKSIVYLDLSNNYLTELDPEVFCGEYDTEYYRPLKLLRRLDLSHNGIRSLHPDLFLHLPNLESLDLSHNPIKIIDDKTRMALSKISFIKVLKLSYTGIDHLPEYFLHNANFLKILDLEGNKFTEIPKNFTDDGHDLVHINLEKNPITNST